MRRSSKNVMQQSLSSNQLLTSPKNQMNAMTLQKLSNQIESVKCSSCSHSFGFDDFITHNQVCVGRKDDPNVND